MQSSYPSSPFVWYDSVLGREMQRNMMNQQPISTPTYRPEYQAWLETELKNRFQPVNTRPVRLTRQPSWLQSGNYDTK